MKQLDKLKDNKNRSINVKNISKKLWKYIPNVKANRKLIQ